VSTLHKWPVCPVCGNFSVNPIYRKCLWTQQPLSSEVIGYRCGNGHVFTPPAKAKPAGLPVVPQKVS